MNQLYDVLWRIVGVNWLLCYWRGDYGRKPPADQRNTSPHLMQAAGRINTVECNCKPHSVFRASSCTHAHTHIVLIIVAFNACRAV